MYSVTALEQACAAAWPPVVEDKVGDWLLRAAAGYTGRANSALAVGNPGVPVAEALNRVREFGREHDIAAKVQVVDGDSIEPELTAAGWRPDEAHAAGVTVSVMLGPLPDTSAPDAVTLPHPTPEWWELAVGTATPTAAQQRVITGNNAAGDVTYCAGMAGDTLAGTARGAIVGDLLHLSTLAVREQHRGNGLAGRMMDTLGSWAAQAGATRCVLQVATHNDTAIRLYSRRGFTESHRYRYWIPADTWEDRTP